MHELDDFQELNALKLNECKITYNLRKRENPLLLGDEFLIGDFLGEGVSAKVYEALDLKSLKRRALKLYEIRRIFKLHNYEERVEMLKMEIKLLTRLEHKHLIKYHDVYTNQNQCTHLRDICIYAIMEYCIGCVDDLMEAYDNKRLPIKQAHKYFGQLMLAVQYLHSQGVIHKDIKTTNMLIDLSDNIKLTDLGVCEVINQFQQLPMCIKTSGSFVYQSPELFELNNKQFRGDSIDVWACGITLFYMITGKFPFEGKLLQLIDKICHQDVQLPADFQIEILLADLIKKMLHKDAEQRVSISNILRHEWMTKDPEQQLCLNHPCAIVSDSLFGVLPRSSLNRLHIFNLFTLLHVLAQFIKLLVKSFKTEFQNKTDIVRPKQRTKYEDLYRSMSITPFLYQLHYPIFHKYNQAEISEDELEEFEQLRRIPLARSNRQKSKKRQQTKNQKLYSKFCQIMGFQINQIE